MQIKITVIGQTVLPTQYKVIRFFNATTWVDY